MVDSKVVVYHICYGTDIGNFDAGYIGITKNFDARIKQHKRTKAFMKQEGLVWYILFSGTREEASTKERELRPKAGMGWNIGIGGCNHATKMVNPDKTLEKVCPVCGEEFTTYVSIDQKTCSRKCSVELSRVNKERICPVCNCVFNYKHNKQVCCSYQCGSTHSGHRNKDKLCEVCNSLFHPPRKTTKVCSKECLCKLRSINKIRRDNECI